MAQRSERRSGARPPTQQQGLGRAGASTRLLPVVHLLLPGLQPGPALPMQCTTAVGRTKACRRQHISTRLLPVVHLLLPGLQRKHEAQLARREALQRRPAAAARASAEQGGGRVTSQHEPGRQRGGVRAPWGGCKCARAAVQGAGAVQRRDGGSCGRGQSRRARRLAAAGSLRSPLARPRCMLRYAGIEPASQQLGGLLSHWIGPFCSLRGTPTALLAARG